MAPPVVKIGPSMTQGETLALMGVMDEIRRQIGLRYAADRV